MRYKNILSVKCECEQVDEEVFLEKYSGIDAESCVNTFFDRDFVREIKRNLEFKNAKT